MANRCHERLWHGGIESNFFLIYIIVAILLKFEHSEKATKFELISHLILHLLGKRQIKWEIVSIFVAFLENMNFIDWSSHVFTLYESTILLLSQFV